MFYVFHFLLHSLYFSLFFVFWFFSVNHWFFLRHYLWSLFTSEFLYSLLFIFDVTFSFISKSFLSFDRSLFKFFFPKLFLSFSNCHLLCLSKAFISIIFLSFIGYSNIRLRNSTALQLYLSILSFILTLYNCSMVLFCSYVKIDEFSFSLRRWGWARMGLLVQSLWTPSSTLSMKYSNVYSGTC